jgi:hypothetical protein
MDRAMHISAAREPFLNIQSPLAISLDYLTGLGSKCFKPAR